MHETDVNRVRLTDKMVLVGFGLAAIYWFLDTFLHIFMSYDVQLFQGAFGIRLSDLWTRLIVCCLFVIFGSHSQVTVNTRRLIEETLRKREERYRTIIENTEDGYYESDLEARLMFFNDALCQISGYAGEELMEMDIRKAMDRQSVETVLEAFQTVRRTGQAIRSIEWTLVKRDGETCFVESSISPIHDTKQQIVGFRGFLRDVTQRKKEEDLKREKMAAEAASKSKSEFLANMSHEIRTPLNSIIGLVELLSETKLSADQKEDLSVVDAAARSLLALINDILDFSKIEAGRLELENICFSLRTLLGESLRIMFTKAHEKGIELAFRVAPNVPDRVFGDPARFRQILLNLVGNAIKFTEKGEVVVEATAEGNAGRDIVLHFTVRDTGIGIPRDKQAGIFRIFEQADGSTSRRYGGTGLGLAVSSQLVELMGGRIWVESDPAQGSTFHYTVRFATSEIEECKIADQESADLKGRIAIVVDDNATNRRIVREALEGWGVSAITAGGTEEAKEWIERRKSTPEAFHLAVIDADIPGKDGMSLARWITEKKGLDIQTVMMLTPTSLRDRSRLEDMGIRGFVSKPVTPSDLLNAVLIALGRIPADSGEKPEEDAQRQAPASAPLRVLVVEDTPFNQKYIKRLLDRWGHDSAIAENGIQALEKLDTGTYDLILMDVQMPEMDGFEATRAIRKREEQTGRHIPIIAMTAHAMKGDMERCLDAGMDDYVSKPISTEALREAIAKLIAGNERVPPTENAAEAPDDGTAEEMLSFDKAALLNAFDNDLDFLQETVGMLLEDYPPMLTRIREAIAKKDAEELRRTAHALKGMVGNFQAKSAAEAAFRLEELGRMAAFADADPAYDVLAAEMERFNRDIVKLVNEEGS